MSRCSCRWNLWWEPKEVTQNEEKGILIVLLVLAVILAAGSMFTVAEDEYACTVRFSKIIDTTSEAGLHFKLPLWTA